MKRRPESGAGAASEHVVHGGGVFAPYKYLGPGFPVGIFNTTITGNRIEAGVAAGANHLMGAGGIGLIAPPTGQFLLLHSSIVSNSIGGPDIACLNPGYGVSCDPINIGGNYNLVETIQAPVITLAPDTIRSDPLLGPLADNGGTVAGAPGAVGTGPLLTHGLQRYSPAINAGDDGAVLGPPLEFDQRGPGFPRRLGPRADIGAFEVALARQIPVLGPWALALMSALLGFFGLRRLRHPRPLMRRRHPEQPAAPP